MCLKSRGLGRAASMAPKVPRVHPSPVPRPMVLTRDEGPVWAQKPPGRGREAFSLWWPWMWSAKICLLISTLRTGPKIPACLLCPGWAWSPHVSHRGLLGHHFGGQLWPLNQPAPRGRSGDLGSGGQGPRSWGCSWCPQGSWVYRGSSDPSLSQSLTQACVCPSLRGCM